MRKKLTMVIAMMAVSVAFTVQTGFAQDKQNKKDDLRIVDTIKETELSRQVDLAMGLVDYGYANKSALSLLQAAMIFDQHPMASLEVYDSEGQPLAESSPMYSYAPSDLLKDAKLFAKKDADLLAYIEKAEKQINRQTRAATKTAGASATITLGAGKTKTITLDATPLSYNRVSARSNNYADLRLSVGTFWEEKGSDTGTNPRVNFLLGASARISVTVTNLENSSTTVEISHMVIDVDDVSNAFN